MEGRRVSHVPLPGIAEAREIAAPVMIEVITGNRWITNGEERSNRERSLFTLHEQTGLFQAETPYGTYSYTWPPAHRRENLFDFLASLDFGYFMGKAYAGDYRELDLAATCGELRKMIIEKRIDSDLDKDNAREAWDRLRALEDEGARDENEFAHAWNDAMLEGLCSVFDLPFNHRDKFECRHFWDVIWPVLINSDPFRSRRALANVA